MFTPNDLYVIKLENEQRLKKAMYKYEVRSHPAIGQAALHRRAIARFGATLVHVGQRLQAVNNEQHAAPQLDPIRNA
ncbi:MAG: hypothetical protein CL610_13675 [Anaerolineaceae bacterium]|nr:hypothetical protein [Anaerolineaceae bacterium]